MAADIKKHSKNGRKKEDLRQTLTLYLSAKQGDLLKEILFKELENAKSKGESVRSREISRVLTSVQDVLDQAEYFVRMRNQSNED